ncbi:hypothetical protein EVA_18181 [gut metagenome]|uniref:Uncharacterized protein n=1 Tax=gut metagenome TaxID=749906 RepID=J9FVW4_9ZZZZ
MAICQRSHFPAPRRSYDESFLYKEGFVDFLESPLVFSHSSRNRIRPDRTAVELRYYVRRILLSTASSPLLSILRASRA